MTSKVIICLLIWLTALLINVETKLTPVISTTNGPVQGQVLYTAINSIPYSSFKGIPYAEPPLGYLRFKPPIEIKPWTDVLPTTKEGANCIQKDFVYRNYTGSEDCLYLNVYTPKFTDDASDLLTVMVWIYGGSFKSGYSNSSLYGPDYIIEDNVVLVTFNYRVGPLGFLNLNHENATGNAALKDQNLVLRWVKANIEKFGGNPNDVTLFGQSAGGVAVDLHVLSDLSRGLFHKAISMSGSPLCPWAFQVPEAAVAQAFVLGEKLGKPALTADKLLKNLYESSALEIMEKANDMGFADPPFKPTIESTTVAQDQEKFLTECPYARYLSNDFNKVPYITGFTSNETLLFAESAETFLDLVTFTTNTVKSLPSKSPISLPTTTKVLTTLTEDIKSFSNFVVDEVIEETSDVIFIAGIDYKRRLLQSRSGYPVYLYRFAYESDESLHQQLYHIDINGTAHGDDFGYLFHMTVANQSMDPENPSFITRKRMVRLWTNFAKYGNPTPDGIKDTLLQGITWPSTEKNDSYLEFEENLSIRQDPADTTVSLVEAADIVILPFQTGCVADFIEKIVDLNPFTDEIKSIGSTIKNSTEAIFSKIPVIG